MLHRRCPDPRSLLRCQAARAITSCSALTWLSLAGCTQVSHQGFPCTWVCCPISGIFQMQALVPTPTPVAILVCQVDVQPAPDERVPCSWTTWLSRACCPAHGGCTCCAWTGCGASQTPSSWAWTTCSACATCPCPHAQVTRVPTRCLASLPAVAFKGSSASSAEDG